MKKDLKSSKSIIKIDEFHQNEKKINLETVKRTWIPQNFSSLLNKPESDSNSLVSNIAYYTSYLIYGSSKPKPVNLESGIKNLSYRKNQCEDKEQSSLNETIESKIYDEDFNIDEFSMIERIPTEESFRSNLDFQDNNILTSLNSNISHKKNNKQGNTKKPLDFPSKLLLKKLIKETFEEYLKKVKPYINLYKKNHIDKNKNSLLEIKDEFYSSNKAFLKVDSMFFNFKDFKIPHNYFSTDINVLQKISYDLINSGGFIEKELLNTLIYIPKLQYYIRDNLDLNISVDKALLGINQIKSKMISIKNHFIVNNAKTIKLSLKRNHVKSMITLANLLTKLKMCKDCLNVLSKNPSKYQLVFDLVNKSQELIEQTNSFTKKYKKTNGSLDCILNYEYEFRKYTTSSSDKAFDDFINNFNSYVSTFFEKNTKFINLEEFLKINNEKGQIVFNLFCDVNLLMADDINFSNYFNSLATGQLTETFNIEQIHNISNLSGNNLDLYNKSNKVSNILEELLGIILRLDLNFYTKIKSLIRKTIVKNLNENIEIIFANILKNSNNLIANLIILYYLRPLMKNSIELLYCLHDFILVVYDSSNIINNTNKSINVKEVFNEEFKNAEKEIFEEITSKFIYHIDKISFKGMNPLMFFKLKKIINIVYSDIIVNMSRNKEFIPVINEICEKIENKKKFHYKIFVNDYYENYHSYILGKIDADDFKIVSSIPYKLASIVKLIEDFEFLKEDDDNVGRCLSFVVSKLAKDKDKDKEKDKDKDKDKDKVEVEQPLFNLKGDFFKSISSSNTYVELSFSTIIILLNSLDNDETIKVFSSYFKLLKNVAFYKRELVIEAKGTGKNFQKISQNHLIYLSADVNLLIKLNEMLINKFSNNIEAIKEIFNEFKINLDSIKYECKASIIELYKDKISEAILELTSIDFSSYPISQNQVNKHLKIINTLFNLYQQCLNAFDSNEIDDLIGNLLSSYFNGYDKILLCASKMDNEECQKQFKSDMLYLKKCLGSFELINISPFKDKIDFINKTVLPSHLLLKKKTTVKKIQ